MIEVIDSIPWVRCASGNVFNFFSNFSQLFSTFFQPVFNFFQNKFNFFQKNFYFFSPFFQFFFTFSLTFFQYFFNIFSNFFQLFFSTFLNLFSTCQLAFFCISFNVGHQMAPLALPHCLGLPYGHHQLVLSCYPHQPESHQLSLQIVLYGWSE